jgi:serine/threonine protein kinase
MLIVNIIKLIFLDKPDNTIVNSSGTIVRLCDFGSAIFEDEAVVTSELVSRYYRPPEIFLGIRYDTKVDIWSYGCSLFELYTGKILFPGVNNNDMLKLIMKVKGPFSEKLIKKGQYSNLYFNDELKFLSFEIDSFSRKPFVKPIDIPKINSSQKKIFQLLQELKPNVTFSKQYLNELNDFASFLDGCLHLDANKRFSAVDALCHKFVGIKPIKK